VVEAVLVVVVLGERRTLFRRAVVGDPQHQRRVTAGVGRQGVVQAHAHGVDRVAALHRGRGGFQGVVVYLVKRAAFNIVGGVGSNFIHQQVVVYAVRVRAGPGGRAVAVRPQDNHLARAGQAVHRADGDVVRKHLPGGVGFAGQVHPDGQEGRVGRQLAVGGPRDLRPVYVQAHDVGRCAAGGVVLDFKPIPGVNRDRGRAGDLPVLVVELDGAGVVHRDVGQRRGQAVGVVDEQDAVLRAGQGGEAQVDAANDQGGRGRQRPLVADVFGVAAGERDVAVGGRPAAESRG
jgi:hypothetical protein